MDNYLDVKKRLMLISDAAADALIRRCMPMEDGISENQARKLYGDKWVRKMKREGLVHLRREGIKTVYSRCELDRLRRQEREPAKILSKTNK
jgi:hypothetical protein